MFSCFISFHHLLTFSIIYSWSSCFFLNSPHSQDISSMRTGIFVISFIAIFQYLVLGQYPADIGWMNYKSSRLQPTCHPIREAVCVPPTKTLLHSSLPCEKISSVRFSHSVVPYSLQPHGLQHARLPCPSPTLRASSDSCPSVTPPFVVS